MYNFIGFKQFKKELVLLYCNETSEGYTMGYGISSCVLVVEVAVSREGKYIITSTKAERGFPGLYVIDAPNEEIDEYLLKMVKKDIIKMHL